MRCFLNTLGEKQQRLFASLEATKRGKGGEKLLALITGLSQEAIVVGQDELRQLAFGDTDQTSSQGKETEVVRIEEKTKSFPMSKAQPMTPSSRNSFKKEM